MVQGGQKPCKQLMLHLVQTCQMPVLPASHVCLHLQGCAEIRWLATKMGAKTATISGLSGGSRCFAALVVWRMQQLQLPAALPGPPCHMVAC